ncbi:MAG: insulinase family protein [Bacteroidales bacterium]|nr:insulinase family protein [Bacteroidales bacterium]
MREIILKNGMRVWLDVDTTLPSVFGAVVVRAGAKDCPNTGIAHYFEHIMFKGTQRIGTVDYEAERPWLDKITTAYDAARKEVPPSRRDSDTVDSTQPDILSKEINELSVKAADYAIPNEYNRLITLYGGSRLNAATGDDFTFYHNSFSPHCLDPWLEIASERFINPVYRLFQSELETVYEEKNMYADNMSSVAVELVRKNYFGTHPYAFPIIGSTEALKHPSLSQMQAFYQKYYGASNMGLILSGNFDPEGIQEKLERTFGRLPKGVVPERVKEPVPVHHGETVKVPLAIPMVKGFALVYPGPENGNPDLWIARLVVAMLTNDSTTGLLDRLTLDHKALITTAGHLPMNDAGILVLLGVPKMPLGTNRGLEHQFHKAIKRLITKDYPEELLNVACEALERELLEELENPLERGKAMVRVFSQGQVWDDFLSGIKEIKSYTQDDIAKVAARYFTKDGFLRLVKKFGKMDPERLKQPGYTPLRPKHAADESAYASELRQRFGNIPFHCRLIDIKNDVTTLPAAIHSVDFPRDKTTSVDALPQLSIFYNPLSGNDLVDLDIIFHRGKASDPILELLPEYFDKAPVNSLNRKEFNLQLAKLGASLQMRVTNDETKIQLEARADRLQQAVALLNDFIQGVAEDPDCYKDVVEALNVADKAFDNNVSTVMHAVGQRALYGDRSIFLRRFSPADAKRGSAKTMMDAFRKVLTAQRSIAYSGPNSIEEVEQAVKLLQLPQAELPVEDTYNTPRAQDDSIYTYHVPKTRQVSLSVLRQLPPMASPRERVVAQLWADYFGGGMSSVMFQELREFRSLGYQTFTQISFPGKPSANTPGSTIMVIGTQADKTQEAVEALDALVNDLPLRPLQFEAIKAERLNRINHGFPTPRQLPGRIAQLVAQGYHRDKNWEMATYGPDVTLDDVAEFHRRVIRPATRSIALVGDNPDTSFLSLPVIPLTREEVIKA